MPVSYNQVAGQSVERLAALSDGVFAVAMTLLVLDLRVPVMEAVHSEHDLWHGLVALSPRLLMYMMSFMTLGIFWIGQHTQLNHLTRSDRSLSWIHILFFCSWFRSRRFRPHFWPNFRGVSHRAGRVLGEHPAVGEHALFQLGLRDGNGVGQGRPAAGNSGRDQTAHRGGPSALCCRCPALYL